MENAGCQSRIKNGPRNHSAKFRPLIVQLSKADQAPLTIKAEKKNESLQNVKEVSAGHDHPRFDDRLRIGNGGKRVNPCDGQCQQP
jgi:hypothetical protein